MADNDTIQEASVTGVFISWSGDRSKRLARVLYNWLPDVLQSIKPFMSEKSIEAGELWGGRLFNELSSSYKCGIVCVTSENTRAPWLLFETGALTMAFRNTRVIPLLLDDTPENLEKPLGMLNAVTATEDGLRRLVESVNTHTQNLEPERVVRSFTAYWPALKAELEKIPAAVAPAPQRDMREMIAEVLDTVRALERAEAGRAKHFNPALNSYEMLQAYVNAPANPSLNTLAQRLHATLEALNAKQSNASSETSNTPPLPTSGVTPIQQFLEKPEA